MQNKLKLYIKEFEEKTGGKVIYVTMSGSKLYGTDNELSDTDFKGVFIPSKKSVILKEDLNSYVRDTNNSKEKNSPDDIDFTLHSIYSFFNQLSKSETGAIDVLFSMFREDTIVYKDEKIFNIIKSNYKVFLNSNMKSFIGYALGQTKKFGIKGARYEELDTFVKEYFNTISSEVVNKDNKIGVVLFASMEAFIDSKSYKYIRFVEAPGPRGKGTYDNIKYISVLGKLFDGSVSVEYFMERVTKLYDQFGNRTKTIATTPTKTDFKALSHSLRIALEVKELLETEFIMFPLKDANFIREIKEGKYETEKIINEVQNVLSQVDELLLVSEFPKHPDEEKVEQLLLSILSTQWGIL